jgi:hypothetical protein
MRMKFFTSPYFSSLWLKADQLLFWGFSEVQRKIPQKMINSTVCVVAGVLEGAGRGTSKTSRNINYLWSVLQEMRVRGRRIWGCGEGRIAGRWQVDTREIAGRHQRNGSCLNRKVDKWQMEKTVSYSDLLARAPKRHVGPSISTYRFASHLLAPEISALENAVFKQRSFLFDMIQDLPYFTLTLKQKPWHSNYISVIPENSQNLPSA